MKRTVYLTCGTLLAAMLLCNTGCKSTEKAAASENAPAVQMEADTLVTAPAFTYITLQDSTIECFYEVDYPRQSGRLATGVKQFIADKLAAIYLPHANEDEARKDYPLFQGDVQQCDSLVRHYAEGTKRYFAALQRDIMAEGLGNDWIPHFLSHVKLKKREETPTYVTYSMGHEVYLGGAHGSYYYTETAISKRTCRPLAQTVDTTKVMQMQPLLRKGIVSYLTDCGIEKAETDYKDYLFLPDDGHFPLPVNAPCPTKDGMAFVYQQYEIASYAVGLVSFTVPYADIMPYLCEEMKSLLEKEKQ